MYQIFNYSGSHDNPGEPKNVKRELNKRKLDTSSCQKSATSRLHQARKQEEKNVEANGPHLTNIQQIYLDLANPDNSIWVRLKLKVWDFFWKWCQVIINFDLLASQWCAKVDVRRLQCKRWRSWGDFMYWLGVCLGKVNSLLNLLCSSVIPSKTFATSWVFYYAWDLRECWSELICAQKKAGFSDTG